MSKTDNRKKYNHSNDLIKYSEDGLLKRCPICTEFMELRKSHGYCNSCWNIIQRMKKNGEDIKDFIQQYYYKWDELREKYEDVKKCNTCLEIKSKNDFYPDKTSSSGYQNKCIDCVKEYNKTSDKNSNPHHKEKHREYLDKNKVKHRARRKERYNTEPEFKLLYGLRTRINSIIKNKRINKNNRSFIYVGCSLDEFKQHLEQQFLPEMTWENHGKVWEIDHVIPCASFKFLVEGDLFKCFHFSNHQPLFKTTEIAESFGYINHIGNREKADKIL